MTEGEMMPSSEAENRFADAIRAMLGRHDFLLPLAAAERQFRQHYYGLNSAALLEDLFFDAVGNYLHQFEPARTFERPPPGQKGWDYRFEGVNFSHKVSQTVGDIAAIWDATLVDIETWSFNEPVVYVVNRNSPGLLKITFDMGTLSARALGESDVKAPLSDRSVLLIRWPSSGGQPVLLEAVHNTGESYIADVLPFDHLWSVCNEERTKGTPINEIEVLITRSKLKPLLNAALEPGVELDIEHVSRAGVYVLPRELLTNLGVISNNRAILVPKATVKELMEAARIRGNFVPFPGWYSAYADDRPPDLFIAQRRELDARFSARAKP